MKANSISSQKEKKKKRCCTYKGGVGRQEERKWRALSCQVNGQRGDMSSAVEWKWKPIDRTERGSPSRVTGRASQEAGWDEEAVCFCSSLRLVPSIYSAWLVASYFAPARPASTNTPPSPPPPVHHHTRAFFSIYSSS
jgi:hypothetical protein